MRSPIPPALKVAGCSYDAALHACKRWHYSGTIPAGKTVKYGAWEDGVFVGCVIFSRGATPRIGTPYGLTQYEICELTRVALTTHGTPVSRIVAIGLRQLRRDCPGLRLILSYADPDQGHVGGIYQAMGWIYTGLSGSGGEYSIDGERIHSRTIHANYGTVKACVERFGDRFKAFYSTPKYRYLLPLDATMREQIEKLRQPYPKRAKDQAAGNQPPGPGQCDSDPPAPTVVCQTSA